MLEVLRNGVPLTSATSTRTACAGDDGVGGVLRRLQPDVAGEVVERAGGDDRQRQPVLQRHGGGRGDAAVAAGHAERLRPAGAGRLAEQLVDAGVRRSVSSTSARGSRRADVLGGVVVVGARARVDGDDEALALGQRRRLVRRPHAGRLLRAGPATSAGWRRRRRRPRRARRRRRRGSARRRAPGSSRRRAPPAPARRRPAGSPWPRRSRTPPPRRSGRSGRTGCPARGAAGGGDCRFSRSGRTPAEEPLEDDVDEQRWRPPASRARGRRPGAAGPCAARAATPMTSHSRPWLAKVESRRSQRSAGVVGRRPMNACRRASQSRGEDTIGR